MTKMVCGMLSRCNRSCVPLPVSHASALCEERPADLAQRYQAEELKPVLVGCSTIRRGDRERYRGVEYKHQTRLVAINTDGNTIHMRTGGELEVHSYLTGVGKYERWKRTVILSRYNGSATEANAVTIASTPCMAHIQLHRAHHLVWVIDMRVAVAFKRHGGSISRSDWHGWQRDVTVHVHRHGRVTSSHCGEGMRPRSRARWASSPVP